MYQVEHGGEWSGSNLHQYTACTVINTNQWNQTDWCSSDSTVVRMPRLRHSKGINVLRQPTHKLLFFADLSPALCCSSCCLRSSVFCCLSSSRICRSLCTMDMMEVSCSGVSFTSSSPSRSITYSTTSDVVTWKWCCNLYWTNESSIQDWMQTQHTTALIPGSANSHQLSDKTTYNQLLCSFCRAMSMHRVIANSIIL